MHARVPREQWLWRQSAHGLTLIHHAAQMGDDAAVAELLRLGADPNLLTRREVGQHGRVSPAQLAAYAGRHSTLRLLLAAGARLRSGARHDPYVVILGEVIANHHDDAVRLLLMTGFRLHPSSYHTTIRQWMTELERGIGAARAAVVTLVGLRRTRRALVGQDRFIVRLMALHVWSTRDDAQWH